MDLEDPQGTKRYSGWRAYQQSKLANILFTYRLAALLEGTKVTANCLHPGFVASKFGQNNGWLFSTFLKTLMRFSAIDVEAGARTSVHVATSADVAGRLRPLLRQVPRRPPARSPRATRKPAGACGS